MSDENTPPTAPPKHAVRVQDVSKRYGRHWALARVSFEIPPGHSVLLTGPNGAGKTTLLRVLSTALKPTFGHLEVFGQRRSQRNGELCRRIGIVTHANFLYEDLTAEENLSLTARFQGKSDLKRILEILEWVGLGHRRHSAVRTFSAGMRRRLCMARVLLREPDLILLDEPFSQLDPGGVKLAEQFIADQQGAGKTILLATHDIERGRRLCDLHLEMKGGRVVRNLEPIAHPQQGAS